MNKEQTEQVITLVFSTIVFILGLISVYLYSTGFYDIYFENPIVMFGIILGTVLAIGFGGMYMILSIYGINEAREDE